MKHIIYISLFILIAAQSKAQFPSQATPTQYSTGWFRQGWPQADSGTILANRLPNFTPRFPGTIILYQQGGVDSSVYYYNGGRWLKISQFDSISLSNRINLKLNITDTTGKWLAQSSRLVDTVYRVNDSTVGYTIKGVPYTFQILGRASGGGGGGSGTVTSVALSMPSAFTVTGSPITTNGTFNVTGAGTSAEYIRGNGTLATTDTGMIPNFYLKVRSLLSGTSPIVYNSTTGAISIPNANNTGTKGAATFNNSDFTDNGAGLISLRNPPGGPAVDTIFRTPGIDSTYFTINGIQYAILDSTGGGGGGGGTVTNVSGTSNRITVTSPTTTPVIDIAATYVGQTSITTLGTIGTGTWNGTTIGPTFGGTGQTTVTTGDLLYGSASNVWSKLAAGTNGYILTMAAGVPSWAPASGGGGGTVTQVNTGYGLTGGPITTTGTIVADTTSSNGLATKSYVNAALWPEEAPIGVIYNKNNWANTPNLTDFAVNTSGGSTAQIALSGGYINYTVSSIDWDNYTAILPIRPTILPQWSITVDFKMITAPSSNTVGFGLGTRRIIGGNGDVLCYINTQSGGGSGTLVIGRGDGTGWQTGSSFTVHQNDVISLNVTFVDSSVTFTANNITTGLSGSISYTNTLVSAMSPISLLSNWALIGHSTGACTWQVQRILISSQTKRNANLVGVGDSKFQGAFATYFATRAVTLLGNTYPSSIVYASGNATILDFLSRMGEEMTYLNGVQYLISLGSNDKRNGATLAEMQDRYTKLIKILQGGGATVRHIVIPEDSTAGGVGLTDFKNWVAATYPNDYIDVWTFMSTSNVLKAAYNSGDGVHPSNAGNLVIDSLIRASGKILVTPAVRRFPLRVTDNNIKISRDSIYLDPIDKAENYVNHIDINGASRTGLLQDNGVTVGVSNTAMIPVTNVQFSVTGQIGVNGATNGIVYGDRTRDLINGATFATYAEGGFFKIFSGPRGADACYWDSLGRMAMGGVTLGTAPTAYANFPAGVATAGHAPIKFNLTAAALLSNPEAGAMEAIDSFLLYTNFEPHRDTLATRRYVQNFINTGGSATTIYNGDGTLSGNRTVTGGSNSLTFDAVFNFRVNANTFLLAKSTPGAVYTTAVIGSGNIYELGYTPTPTVYGKGAGLFIDTNNNAGLGVNMPTSAPLYATGLNTFANNLLVGGSIFEYVINVTSNTTLDLTKHYVRIDATSGNVTVTLPAASTAFGSSVGIHYIFKRIDNSGNTITISRAGSDTIDGGTSITLTTQYEVKELQCSSTSTWDVR
jgi:hypothetical protein